MGPFMFNRKLPFLFWWIADLKDLSLKTWESPPLAVFLCSHHYLLGRGASYVVVVLIACLHGQVNPLLP